METLQRLDEASPDQCRLTLKPKTIPEDAWRVPLRLLKYKTLESTNTTAYQLGERGSPEWTVVVADTQTKGRGRNKNKWESVKGGLWFSILLKPRISSAKLSILQFLAANATRQALEDETRLKIQLKWPNDLVTNRGKLGGILVESKTTVDKVAFAVIGIGINVNQRQDALPKGAVSLLRETRTRYERLRLLRAVVHATASRLNDLDNPSSIMKEWWHNCIHRPFLVQITGQNETVSGITRSIDEEGALVLETDDHNVRRISEGTLRLLDDQSG